MNVQFIYLKDWFSNMPSLPTYTHRILLDKYLLVNGQFVPLSEVKCLSHCLKFIWIKN